jgi:hypothetical protein
VVFTATLPGTAGNTPVSGAGVRMMWYADKGAFRVGNVTGNNWNKDSIGYFSFASGFNTKAKGSYSNAWGESTSATGDIGSTAFGYLSKATARYSTAWGESTTANGYASTASGYTTFANGLYSFATGSGSKANGNYSTAMGIGTLSSGDASTALGSSTTAKAPSSLSIGVYNDNLDTPDPSFEDPADRIFQVGNGSFSTRKNALTILRNGNVGIGQLAPVAPLSFKSVIGEKVNFYGDGQPSYGIGVKPYLLQIHTDQWQADIAFGYGWNEAFTETMRIRGNGAISLKGNPGNAGQVLTSNGNDSTATWNNKPIYFFFERAPGAAVALANVYQNITPVHGQNFTLTYNANLIVTVKMGFTTFGGETNIQDLNYFFQINGASALYRMQSESTIKPQASTFVENNPTISEFIPNVSAGTYSITLQAKKWTVPGSAFWFSAQVIIQAVPL